MKAVPASLYRSNPLSRLPDITAHVSVGVASGAGPWCMKHVFMPSRDIHRGLAAECFLLPRSSSLLFMRLFRPSTFRLSSTLDTRYSFHGFRFFSLLLTLHSSFWTLYGHDTYLRCIAFILTLIPSCGICLDRSYPNELLGRKQFFFFRRASSMPSVFFLHASIARQSSP